MIYRPTFCACFLARGMPLDIAEGWLGVGNLQNKFAGARFLPGACCLARHQDVPGDPVDRAASSCALLRRRTGGRRGKGQDGKVRRNSFDAGRGKPNLCDAREGTGERSGHGADRDGQRRQVCSRWGAGRDIHADASASGLGTQQTVTLQPGQVLQITLQLNPSIVTTSVTVAAADSAAQSPAPAQTITEKTLRDAPNYNERMESLLPLVPGVHVVGYSRSGDVCGRGCHGDR